VDPATGLIDYDGLEKSAALFKPKLIIAGVSCYARNLDYARFRQIADQNGSLLMADMAHVRYGFWWLLSLSFGVGTGTVSCTAVDRFNILNSLNRYRHHTSGTGTSCT
jgi:Serine hydroxymethyltransferase